MEETKIDKNLYSRQIGTFGLETMGKLIQMKVFIYGMRGLGVEIAKNIILAGPNEVSIFDPQIVSLTDLGSNFYITESDIGKSRRDQASLPKLGELNPYVKTNIFTGLSLKENIEALKYYHVVVITEVIPTELAFAIDEICRKNKSGFIYTASLGITGYAFVDFGTDFPIKDENGEECKQYIVRNVSNGNPGIVMIDDTIGTGKLAFSDGDFVVFKEIQGMSELNDNKPREIKYVSPFAFSINEDTTKFGEYQGGGIVEQIKVPKLHNYKALSESLYNPYNDGKVPDPIDFSKFGRNELLHVAFCALFNWAESNGGLPNLNDETSTADIINLAKQLYNNLKEKNSDWIKNASEFDEVVVGNVARWARAQIVPVNAFLGGVVAQEIVKFTGKYTPINQWLWFDFFETTANLKDVDRNPLQTRYDDQIAIYGREIQEKFNNMNIFMIGAGALGCEFIKNFALMGISTKNGKTIVTDNDNIEVSNLNRQFLFRKNDVGHSKSQRACAAMKYMNPEFKCADLQSRVGPENEHIFDDKFWDSQDFIINAVDNIKARKYIDSQCTWHNKVLIDSGTLGTKAHVQLVVPNVTSCYNDTQDPPEESIPMCTLHNFPAMIEHCIEWGRDHFTGYFTDIIRDAHELLNDPGKFYVELKRDGNATFQLEKLENIQKLISIMQSKDLNKCIEYGVEKFTENFDHRIRQLLHNFPPDYTNPDGSKFWSGSKRVPTPLTYDAKDPLHAQFVLSYSILIGLACNIAVELTHEQIIEYSSKIQIKQFSPKKLIINVNENENNNQLSTNVGMEEEEKLSKLMKDLSIADKAGSGNFKPHEFEKDDDSNQHIDFINSASNLRARNYKIKECDRDKTKMIAGKIIPAIATTTAAITGLVSLQIYTLLQTRKIDFMRNTFMNLAVSLFVLTEPAEKIEAKDKAFDPILLGPVKAIPPKWTVWDKIVIQGPLTIKEFIALMMKTYNIDVSIITSKGVTIIQTFMPSNKDRFDQKIEDIFVKNSKHELMSSVTYIPLEVSADTEDGSTALIPLIKYIFR